jgi:hypothetical protein
MQVNRRQAGISWYILTVFPPSFILGILGFELRVLGFALARQALYFMSHALAFFLFFKIGSSDLYPPTCVS